MKVMKRFILPSWVLALSLCVGRLGVAGPPPCTNENGNANGDTARDLSDAVYVLAWLFQGGPMAAEFCTAAGPKEVGCAAANANTNGDAARDLSDVIYLLAWLFQGGPPPVGICPTTCQGGPSDLPATGRTGCKDEDGIPIVCISATCRGQDGFYLAGCPNDENRFTAHGDGTVTDNCTGLMWLQDTADISGDGPITSDVFPLGDRSSQCEALEYCEVTLNNLAFAGQTDWRLPNIRELQSLADYRLFDPSSAPAIHPVFVLTQNRYWSSTSLADGSGWPWMVYFDQGVAGAPNPAGDPVAYARPVRGGGCQLPDTGQTDCYDEFGAPTNCASATCPGQDGPYAIGCPKAGRFSDNTDGTVTDNCTGLVWEKGNGAGQPLSWCGALAYCEGLTLGTGDRDDWRLPNVRELQSLVDYSLVNPAIDVSVFVAESEAYWSSTSFADGQVARAWVVEFGPLPGCTPGAVVQNTTPSNYVRAVRGGRISPPETVCTGGIDEDMDGLTDCDDGDCATHPTCEALAEATCNDNMDNDLDGSTDCDDCDCIGTANCPAVPRDLPQTGQTVCRDADGNLDLECDDDPEVTVDCPGQDGVYLAGCTLTGAARFVPDDSGTPADPSDDTVIDNCTGLMWHADTADRNVDGSISNGEFPAGDRDQWCDALAYCEGLDFAGHDDWRLPNIRELQSIIDYGRHGPAIDTDFFTSTSQEYWSSTPAGHANKSVWHVWPGEGGVGKLWPDRSLAYIRPVRSGRCLLPATGQTKCYNNFDPPIEIDCASATCGGQDLSYALGCPMEGRFVDNGNGTVTDSCTGLMWQQDTADIPGDPDDSIEWCDALDYCEVTLNNLALGGHTDWRLPNLRELQSIVDYGRQLPAIDPVFTVITGGYWSSTPVRGSGVVPAPVDARWWIVMLGNTEDGNWVESLPMSTHSVRAVREP